MVSCGAWVRAGPIRAHMGPQKIRLQQLALDLATAPGFGNCTGFRNCPWIWQLVDLETDMDSATVAMASFGNCCCGFGNRTGFRIWGLRQLATAYALQGKYMVVVKYVIVIRITGSL